MARTKFTGQQLSGTYPVTRDNNGSIVAEATAKILTGWGWMQNTSGSGQAQMSENVTFNVAFSGLPIVLITYGGDAGNVAAVYGTGTGTAFGAAAMKADNITASGFRATMTTAGSLPNAGTIYYQWMAIGI